MASFTMLPGKGLMGVSAQIGSFARTPANPTKLISLLQAQKFKLPVGDCRNRRQGISTEQFTAPAQLLTTAPWFGKWENGDRKRQSSSVTEIRASNTIQKLLGSPSATLEYQATDGFKRHQQICFTP